ncbi:hypothetical protein Leryth_019762 [Lithospermum erythrorhizon]|nr:hypothetical protein Leryth_019762 [Lithospermum erythrorhizon]
MELKNMVHLASRTGRDMQRYCKGRRQVVGCIPYRYKINVKRSSSISSIEEDDIEVLLISAQRKGKGMLFPKGGWETDETKENAALRETIEEAGVIGDVEELLGKWSFKNKDNVGHDCYMFPLLVKQQLDTWPEKNTRKRLWVSVAEARKVCHYWWMKEALETFVSSFTSQKDSLNMEIKCNL